EDDDDDGGTGGSDEPENEDSKDGRTSANDAGDTTLVAVILRACSTSRTMLLTMSRNWFTVTVIHALTFSDPRVAIWCHGPSDGRLPNSLEMNSSRSGMGFSLASAGLRSRSRSSLV